MTPIAPNDLVKCISSEGPYRKDRDREVSSSKSGHAPCVVGKVYIVEDVVLFADELGLVIQNHHSCHPTRAYLACCFRKIEPYQSIYYRELEDQIPSVLVND